MKFLKIKKYRFVFDFLQKRTIYPFYEGVINTTNNQILLGPPKNSDDKLTEFVHIVNYIPPFLEPKLHNMGRNGLKALDFNLFYGFMADLKDYEDINEYLTKQLGSKSRTKIRSYVRKLESCFSISYKMYFGEMARGEYDFLFPHFHSFLTKRFLQRGDTHELLSSWKFIEETSYHMILNKKASLFVIYNNEQPIDICLNYHHGNILCNGIRSFDIDYSKFRLGHIDILRQLEWCFANGIRIFDLGIGDMEYKRQWCNVIYDFRHQILYEENGFKKKIIANGLVIYYQTKEFLKKKNVHLLYHKVIKFFQVKDVQENKYIQDQFEVVEVTNIPDVANITLLDLLDEANAFLKQPVYNFQFSTNETDKEIKVYKLNDERQTYLIKGQKKAQQLKLL